MNRTLVGLSEIAETFDRTKRTALRYTKRADFPQPVERLASGPVWHRAEVEEWAKSHLPLTSGRPRRDGRQHAKITQGQR
jgi:predicted DNA-binding transcriptional regulator AlpA